VKETEAHIQKAILQWGQYKKVLMHRINVIGTPLHKNGLTVYRPSTNRGMADIHATVLVGKIPVSVWFEVKTKKGKLSPNQKAFQESVTAAGGFYWVVRSIDDVEWAIAEVRQETMQHIKDFVPF
jgi:predicted methyltransferase